MVIGIEYNNDKLKFADWHSFMEWSKGKDINNVKAMCVEL